VFLLRPEVALLALSVIGVLLESGRRQHQRTHTV